MHSLDLTLDFVAAEPHADANSFNFAVLGVSVEKANLDTEMAEVFGDFAAGSFNIHNFVLDSNSNYAYIQVGLKMSTYRPWEYQATLPSKSVSFCFIFFIK